MKLTEKEKDLIEAIRNYRRSFPNGEASQRYYIEQTLAELMDGDDS
jgi:hypothetical protein